MNSPLSAAEDFRTPHAKYELYNFHRPCDRSRAREVLQAAKPRIATLEGLDEENHLLLLESACYQASREGQPWECVRLSFEDYNPDSGTVDSFLNNQLTRREARDGKVQKLREALSGLALGLKAELDVSTAFAISVTVSGGLRFVELLETAAPTFKPIRGYRGEGPERLAALLNILTADSGVVLYLPGSYPLQITLRRWLIDVSKHNDRLLLAFANVGADGAEKMTMGAPVREHFELAPLKLEELTAAVDERFGPNSFPLDFYDALYVQSKGIPWRVAEVMKRLMHAGALEGGGNRPWQIADPEASRTLVSQFISTFYEPVARLRESRNPTEQMVATFIDLSALFRDEIPGYLLCTHLGFERRQADRFLNNVLRLFGPGSETRLLVEMGAHSDFPHERLLRFSNGLARDTFLDAYTPEERDGAASALMDTLASALEQITPGTARLFYFLSMHLTDEGARGQFAEELSWWVGREEAKDLRSYICDAAKHGKYSAGFLLSVIGRAFKGWPPYRLAAIMLGLEDSGVEFPLHQVRSYHHLRANICYELDEFEDGEWHARAGLNATAESDSEGKLLFLALLYHGSKRRGDYAAALNHAEAAVQIASRSRSLSEPAAWAWGHLGGILADLGRASEAEEAAEELLKRAEKAFAPDSEEMARAYLDAARIFSTVGKSAAALPYISEALEIRSALFGPQNPLHASTLIQLAHIQARVGDAAEAKRASDAAIAAATAVHGPEHSRTAGALIAAGNAMMLLGDADAAAALFLRALAIRRQRFGADHDVAHTLNSLAVCFEYSDPRRSEAYLEELVEILIHRGELGWSSWANSLDRLVTLIEESGDLPRAVARGEELLARIRSEPEDGAERDTEPLEQLIAAYRHRLHPTASGPPGLTDSPDRHTQVPESSLQPGEESVQAAAETRNPPSGWFARVRSVLSRKRD